jgi:hypothetical protein
MARRLRLSSPAPRLIPARRYSEELRRAEPRPTPHIATAVLLIKLPDLLSRQLLQQEWMVSSVVTKTIKTTVSPFLSSVLLHPGAGAILYVKIVIQCKMQELCIIHTLRNHSRVRLLGGNKNANSLFVLVSPFFFEYSST